MEPKKNAKKSIEQVLQNVKQALKDYDVKFIDVLVDQSTQKERERFARYRIPMTKYIQRLPKKRQYALRTSPKKKPPTPKKTTPKKKINYGRILDETVDNLIEKISIISELSKANPSKKIKEDTIEFLDEIKDQVKEFQNDMI
jgi:hypothetical protein